MDSQLEQRQSLENWYEIQRKKRSDDYFTKFGAGISSKRTGFHLSLMIRASFHPIYPVSLQFTFGWMPEEKTEPAAAPLNLNTGILDINAPGGVIYDIRDGLNPEHLKPDPVFEPWLRGEGPMPDLEKFKAEKNKSHSSGC
jgi:hypothetical protein